MGIFGTQSSSDSSDINSKTERGFGEIVLMASLADAHLLIMTAAERGIELDEDVTKAILDAEETVTKQLMTPAIASNFWHAYESLSHSLSPITIDSIRATHDLRQLRSGIWGYIQGKMYVPFSRKSAFRYKLLSIVTLLSLITVQVFWSIGDSLVVDIKEQSNRITILKSQLLSAGDTSRQETAGTLSQRVETRKETENITSGTDQGSLAESPAIPSSPQELNRQIGEYISWREAEIIELKNWNQLWGRVLFFTQQSWEQSGFSSLTDEEKTHVHYVSAQYVLHAISTYFLPILYGLLGASFYVLRQLPRDIEGLTFSMNSHIEYSLRITQGPLAGIMASFLFTTTPAELQSLATHSSAIATIKLGSSSLSDFSPLAVAFLAGYSVELIFYVIDKIISAVTTRSTTTTPRFVTQTKATAPTKKPTTQDV